MSALRLGTRKSPMAIAQSLQVARAITAATGREVELVGITTYGDASASPARADRRHRGVRQRRCGPACWPARSTWPCTRSRTCRPAPAEGITLAAVPPRDDPRDALAARDGAKLADLPPGARIGTGSPRRAAQLLMLRRDLHARCRSAATPGTRLAKVGSGELDAVVLAYAGLARIDRLDAVTQVFEPEEMLPAPGQGALAVECRADRDRPGRAAGAAWTTRSAGPRRRQNAACWRRLQAGCPAPVGAYAAGTDVLRLHAVVVAADGGTALRGERRAARAARPSAWAASWPPTCSAAARGTYTASVRRTHQQRGR